jgi:hypothetical protein
MRVAPKLSLGRSLGVAMSVSESGGTLSDVAVLRWTGYGLAALSVAVFLAGPVWPDAPWTIVLLAMAVVSLVVVFRAPEAFEYEMSGGRWFNILVGAPTFLLGVRALDVQLENYTVPIAAALVGAAVLLVAGKVALSRSVMARPGSFQVIAFLMGAAIGYGALVTVDVAYDVAPPATFSSPVLDRYVTYTGRAHGGAIYHLRVAPFGARALSSLRVSYAVYDTHYPGGVVCLQEHSGGVGVPWVAVCGR